jgi:hypothetical protein
VVTTLIKLLVAAAVLNAAARYGLSTWTHYEFRDSVEQTLLFGADSSPQELVDAIMSEAERQNVPLDRESVELERRENVDSVKAAYVDEIELFPRYTYAKTWEFDVQVRHVNTAGMTGRTRRR